MVVEADYDGARLEKEMTPEFISDMLDRFKNGKRLHKKYVYQIVLAVKKIVYDEATMVEVEIEDDANLTVCGDTHGQCMLNSQTQNTNTARCRSILRLDGALQTEWLSNRKALLPIQWGLCRSRILVYRDCSSIVCIQVVAAVVILHKPG